MASEALYKPGHCVNVYEDPQLGKMRPLFLRNRESADWEISAIRDNWWGLGHLKPSFRVVFKGYKSCAINCTDREGED